VLVPMVVLAKYTLANGMGLLRESVTMPVIIVCATTVLTIIDKNTPIKTLRFLSSFMVEYQISIIFHH